MSKEFKEEGITEDLKIACRALKKYTKTCFICEK